MSDLSRRNFFKLFAGAAALVAIPKPLADVTHETIWSDLIHDDAPGLSALLRGDAVQFADSSLARLIGWRGDVLQLDGAFKLSTTVVIDERLSGKTLEGGYYEIHGPLGFRIQGAERCTIKNAHFENLSDGDCIHYTAAV